MILKDGKGDLKDEKDPHLRDIIINVVVGVRTLYYRSVYRKYK